MKTEGQVKHKLAQVKYRHLKREIRGGLSKKSGNCHFNGRVDLPGREGIGICLYRAGDPSQWLGGTCDETVDDRAAQCPYFSGKHTKEQIKDDFNTFMESSDRAHIAERYPDMAALLWVLDLENPELGPEEAEEDEEPPSTQPEVVPRVVSEAIVPISFWDRFLERCHAMWGGLVEALRRG